MPPLPTPVSPPRIVPVADAADSGAIAQALTAKGCCLLQGLPAPDSLPPLRTDLMRLRDAGGLEPASVGRASTHNLRTDIRGDHTLWLDNVACGEAARAHLQVLDALRETFNRTLYLGLHSIEAHYACYPPGTGYRRHRDRFRDDDARVVSLVSYLNQGWRDDDGGMLRLYLDDGVADIAPHAGTTICFLSEIEHEVLSATRERLSIAAWMRRTR